MANAIADSGKYSEATEMMTGAGSAVIDALEGEEGADTAFAALKKRYDRVFRCETCMESVIEQI